MGLWVHVSDTREHRFYELEASRAPSRELKRVSAPKSYSVLRSGLAGLALAGLRERVPVRSLRGCAERGWLGGTQAFRGSAQAPSEPLVDGLSWHRGYPLRTNLNKPSETSLSWLPIVLL